MAFAALSDEIRDMTDKERKRRLVATAKDVIRQLADRRLVATTGVYLFTMEGEPAPATKHTDPSKLQAGVRAMKKCKVCALGGLFVSYVEKYDGVASMAEGHYVEISTTVASIFGKRAARLIEAAFERWEVGVQASGKYGDMARRTRTVEDPSARMEMVMQYVIDTDGDL